MERLKGIDSFDRMLYAADVIDLLKGRPKSFPPIWLLLVPGELLYGEICDACWSMTNNTVEIMTKCGGLFEFAANEKIRQVRPWR